MTLKQYLKTIKRSELITLFTILSPLLGLLLLILWIPDYADYLIEFSKNYPIIAPFILILWRVIGMVIPPIPGGIISIALIPVFGWFLSYIYASAGILIGACISFALARRYREKFVKQIVPLQQVHQWQDKISKNTEFFAFLAIRMATGPVFDFMSYVAGLSKISFRTFFIVTLVSLIPEVFYFFVGETVYQIDPVAGIVAMIIFILLYYILQKAKFFGLFKKKSNT